MMPQLIWKLKRKIAFIFFSPENYARIMGVSIGRDCKIFTKNFGSEPYLISIGNHVHITRGVEFMTHDGAVWVGRVKNPTLDCFGKIVIGDNCFIGNHVYILPGIHVGSNCVVGACSVLTKSVPDGSVVAGNPARFICTTDDYISRMSSISIATKKLSFSNKEEVIKSNLNSDSLILKRYIEIG